MNKDAFLATLIGYGIGLLITGMFLVGPKILRYLPNISFTIPKFTASQPKPTATPSQPPKEFFVTVDSPLPDSIESNKELLVSGTTAAGSTIVIQGNINDAAAEAKTDGKFAGKVTLVEGRNDIIVTSYLKDKKSSQTVTVFHTQEAL
jgi:hypothetical protein